MWNARVIIFVKRIKTRKLLQNKANDRILPCMYDYKEKWDQITR